MKNLYESIFQRIEKKYLLTIEQTEQLEQYIRPYMALDQYGQYTITNIYYDTWDYRFIRQSLEKPVYKEKLRLRSYGVPNEDSLVFIELKKKYQQVVYKRREQMTLEQAKAFLHSKKVQRGNNQILQEISYFLNYYKPVPKQFIAYDRKAYYQRKGGLRLTIDQNIRYRNDELLLENGDYGYLLLPEGNNLLELKTDTAYPLWLTQLLERLEIWPINFSKYGEVYKLRLKQGLEKNICAAAQEASFCSVPKKQSFSPSLPFSLRKREEVRTL